MGYDFTQVDGKRVEVHVAAAFERMDDAFHRKFGLHLKVSAGSRTRAEQERIFRARYVTYGGINGRHVYDMRKWNGTWWYRVSSAGTVAVPGTSNHEIDGPNGPRSIDIRDTGSDWGVTRRGTTRDRWMQRNAHKYHFENEGYAFGEPWHKTYSGSLSGSTASPASTGKVSSLPWAHGRTDKEIIHAEQSWMNHHRGEKLKVDGILGAHTIAAIKRYQKFLGVTADGIWGAKTQAAHKRYEARLKAAKKKAKKKTPKPSDMLKWKWTGIQEMLKHYYGYSGAIDNRPGSGTKKAMRRFVNRSGYSKRANGWPLAVRPIFNKNDVKAIQVWLRKYGYTGKIDGIPGSGTHTAWNKAERANNRAF